MSIAAPRKEVIIKAPELRGAALALGKCTDREVCIEGPAGSGKTIGALFKLHVLLSRYPGSRALVCRKTNTALAGSAMVTYRDTIIRGRDDIYYFGGNRVEPAAFCYSNGSKLIVNGLDKPEKVQSAEFDWALINEATECTLKDVEFVRMRLRSRANGPIVPYHQLIMDCNPDAPTHWLNQRMNVGITTRLLSRHEDNPRYFDTRTQDWTEEGKEYIFGILGGLTGVRYARYRKGIWAAAEGTVYEEEWDPALHVIDRFAIPASWPRYWAIDWGYRNPFVWQAWAENHDGELFCYREIYMTGALVEDHARHVMEVTQGEPLPDAVICDHDAEDRATFERHTGHRTIAAQKAVSMGIQAVQARLRRKGNGRTSLFFLRDSLIERDASLQEKSLPTSTVTEFESYVWDTSNGKAEKEEPLKKFDHGMDALRYLVSYKDRSRTPMADDESAWPSSEESDEVLLRAQIAAMHVRLARQEERENAR